MNQTANNELAIKADLGVWYKLLGNANFNRYGIISIVLLLVGCLGGVAVGMGAINSYAQLIPIVIFTMASLTTILAVSPMKYILSLSSLAVLLDAAIIIYLAIA